MPLNQISKPNLLCVKQLNKWLNADLLTYAEHINISQADDKMKRSSSAMTATFYECKYLKKCVSINYPQVHFPVLSLISCEVIF